MSGENTHVEPGRWYWLEGVRDPVYVHDFDPERGVAYYRHPIPDRNDWIDGRCVAILLHPIILPTDDLAGEIEYMTDLDQRMDALVEDLIEMQAKAIDAARVPPLAPSRAERLPEVYRAWVRAKQSVRLETVVLVETEDDDVFTFGRDADVIRRVYGEGSVIRGGVMSAPGMEFQYLRIRPGYRFPVTHTLNRAFIECHLIKMEGESGG